MIKLNKIIIQITNNIFNQSYFYKETINFKLIVKFFFFMFNIFFFLK